MSASGRPTSRNADSIAAGRCGSAVSYSAPGHFRPWCSIGTDGRLSPGSFRAGATPTTEGMGNDLPSQLAYNRMSLPCGHQPRHPQGQCPQRSQGTNWRKSRCDARRRRSRHPFHCHRHHPPPGCSRCACRGCSRSAACRLHCPEEGRCALQSEAVRVPYLPSADRVSPLALQTGHAFSGTGPDPERMPGDRLARNSTRAAS
jgi:hypothetical protein